MNETIRKIEQAQLRSDIPDFNVGDTVEVRTRIQEENKERVQPFAGVVIKRKGGGINETFTVRRIVQGEGVERTFPFNSPHIVSVKVTRQGKVRRAKLYYLRERQGKAARIKARTAPKAAKKKES